MNDLLTAENDLPDASKSLRPAARPWRRWSRAFDFHNFSTNVAFTNAIWMIYLAGHGYNALELGLLEMLFHLAKFATELPTGIFADILGRRKSLIIYCAILSFESLLFLVPTPPLIILSFVLAGTAYAFRGGSSEALLWHIAGRADPTRQAGRYSQLVSRMYLVALLGEIIGTISGGYLHTILTILPFVARGLFTLLGIIPLLFLPEQQVTASERTSPLLHLSKSMRIVWRSPALVGLLLISGLVDGCWQTIYYFYQLYLHGQNFSTVLIGIIVALSTVTGFLFTALAPQVMRWLKESWLIPLFVLSQMLGLALMSLPQAGLSLFGYLVCFQAAVSVLDPAISTYINQRLPEAQRATVLSLQTGLFSAVMIVLFPLFGLSVTTIPYSTVYLWTLLALITGALGIGLLVLWLRKQGQKHVEEEA